MWLFAETAETEQVQGSESWHRWRAKHIGASEVSAVLGESDFMTAHDLWMLKTGKAEPVKSNWAMQRGTRAEPEIRRLYEELYNMKLTTPVMEYSEWPVLSASLDGYSKEFSLVVEFKFPSKEKHEMALREQVPQTYKAQIQAQLLVAGCDKAHYVSYNGQSIAVVVVEADLKEQQRILAACREFWSMVESDTPPAVTNKYVPHVSQSLEQLSKVYRQALWQQEQAERILKDTKQQITDLIKDDKASFYGFTFLRSKRKGAVDYGKILALEGIDLEPYRKPDSIVITIKEDK